MKKMGVVFVILFTVLILFGCKSKQSMDLPVFYVANAGDGTISIVDLNQSDTAKVIELGFDQLSHGIAISPDESVIYTGTGFSGKSVVAIDSQSYEILEEIVFEEGVHGIDIHPSGKFLYISLNAGLGHEGGTLAIVDTSTFEIIALIQTDDGPAHVSVSSEGSQVWVSNVNANTVSVIDAYTFQILATIAVGEVPNEVALSPTLDYAYSANVKSNSLSIIDMSSFEVIDEILVGEGVHGVTVSHDGKEVWTANNNSNDVTVIDTETLRIIETIETGSYPNHIAFSPNGEFAFVTHRESNDLVVIERGKREIIQTFSLGSEPHEMTLKGLVNNEMKPNVVNDIFTGHFKDYIDGVEFEVILLSPYNNESNTLLKEVAAKDLFNYYAVQIDLTTHSGDLTGLPWTDMVKIENGTGQELQLVDWVVVNNDSHHPRFIAIFEKTIGQMPLLKTLEDQLIFKISPFINEESIEIPLL